MSSTAEDFLEESVDSWLNRRTGEEWDVTIDGRTLSMSCGSVSTAWRLGTSGAMYSELERMIEFLESVVAGYELAHPEGTGDIEGFLAHNPVVADELPGFLELLSVEFPESRVDVTVERDYDYPYPNEMVVTLYEKPPQVSFEEWYNRHDSFVKDVWCKHPLFGNKIHFMNRVMQDEDHETE